MSLERAAEFSAAVAKDPALTSQVTAAMTGKSPDDCAKTFAQLGQSKGYDFTPAEAAVARAEILGSVQLSDEELENVAGGWSFRPDPNARPGDFSSGFYDPLILVAFEQMANRLGPPGAAPIGLGIGHGVVTASHGGSTGDVVRAFATGLSDGIQSTTRGIASIFSGW